MPATIRAEGGNRYRVDISGILRKQELDAVQREAAAEIARQGKVRLLFVLEEFKGWEKGSDWTDMRFYDAHERDVERIAIVGEERWRGDALIFSLADLRSAATRYFLPVELETARAWLAAPRAAGDKT